MRYLYVLVILLICGGVCADDFLGTKADYTSQMRMKLGYAQSDIGALPTTDAEAFVEEGVSFCMSLIRASKQEHTSTTSYKRVSYVLDSTTLGVIGVWWQKADTVKALQYVPISKWSEQEHQQTSGQTDSKLKRPSFYDYTDSILYVYPAPTITGDTLHILAWHDLGNVVSRDTLTGIPQQYRVVILNYATWAAAYARNDSRSQGFLSMLSMSISALNAALNQQEAIVAPPK